jgi:alpha-ribazole phosphatase/probable phosphoglycerate mutase
VQAKQLGELVSNRKFDAVFYSDLKRAIESAELGFGERYRIIQDQRLRECDYGDFEGRPRAEMERARLTALHTPFPNGESYAQVAIRMRSFLTHIPHPFPHF